jgi:citrate lyase subunit beta/citryl-CoA lyase
MTARHLLGSARSFLFVPGNRPDRFDKAAAAGADVVVVDLEDAVAPTDKDDAREHLRGWLRAGNSAMVRINGRDTPWYDADLELVAECGAPTMVAKAEDPAELRRIADLGGGLTVVPLVETAAGILGAAAICAAPGVVRCAFGSIDLATELGIDPGDREALLWARSVLVMASTAASIASPVDGVTTALRDEDILTADVSYARRLGMTGKLCIHPSQIHPVHAALAPSAAELDWARRILDRAGPDGSATAVDGQMVDAPVVERARRMLARAQSC